MFHPLKMLKRTFAAYDPQQAEMAELAQCTDRIDLELRQREIARRRPTPYGLRY